MSESKEEHAGRKPPRRYDDEYKRRAVELSQRGNRTIGEVARELGIPGDALYRWRVEYGVTARKGAPPAPAGPRSVTDLERENRDLRAKLADMQEREIILKKSLGILSDAPGRSMPKWKA
jgi:transposase-like protein